MTQLLEPTPAEQRLIDAAAIGQIADYRSEKYPNDRKLRAEIVYSLCVDPRPEWKVQAKGVSVYGALISGSLDFNSAVLRVPLQLFDCQLLKEINLKDARTRGLDFSGCTCEKVIADGLLVEGSLLLRKGFKVDALRLVGAEIKGNIEIKEAHLGNGDGLAMLADGLVTKGNIFLNNCNINGEVRLVGAQIGGSFECIRTQLQNKNPKLHALLAESVTTNGSLFLNDSNAQGEVRLAWAYIGGSLECEGTQLENPDGYALNAQGMQVKGALVWRNVKYKGNNGLVNFSYAQVEQLDDDERSWPTHGNLILDGFVYSAFSGKAPQSASKRQKWLSIQRDFRPQPYEHLVRVLRHLGRDRDAREIAIAKQDALRKNKETGRIASLWLGFLKLTLSYGYKPWKSLVYIVIFLVLGTLVFEDAQNRKIMVPSKVQVANNDLSKYISCEISYPCLQPIIYSIDAFLPIVDLHQEDYWLPDASKPNGWIYRGYLWLHIFFGWILTTVAVTGLTGLIKKD